MQKAIAQGNEIGAVRRLQRARAFLAHLHDGARQADDVDSFVARPDRPLKPTSVGAGAPFDSACTGRISAGRLVLSALNSGD
jgi:hypothetical protein